MKHNMLSLAQSLRLTHSQYKMTRAWLQWCWWHRYVGDFMMVTDLRCWWQNLYVSDFFRHVGDFFKVFNRSSISQTYHQYIWSRTSVTNIDVTHELSKIRVGTVLYKFHWIIRSYQVHYFEPGTVWFLSV